MCGIAGIFNYGNKRDVPETAVRAMCDRIRHRGPDDEGIFTSAPVGLGIRRLSIIDLATGHQPIHNEDKTVWIVFNGEIYNFKELREALAATHRFSTATDTETIVHLYEQYGESCVDHLRGMFAFALWDAKAGKLFIARDRVGKKPLYYLDRGGGLLFASEIKSILACLERTPEIDPAAIDLYLTYQYIPSPRTIFRDIRSLEPGHTLTCATDGRLTTRRYWSLDFRSKTDLPFAQAAGRVRELLTEATRLRMVADVPLGAFLSGGHDSTIVVGLMSSLSPRQVKTFSIGFEEEDYSELKYARIAAKHFGTDHNEFIVQPDYIEVLPKIAWHYGQPFADSSALPSYFVARETRKHVTVALNGDGGDENFGGYLRYRAVKAAAYFDLPFRLLGKTATRRIAWLMSERAARQQGRYARYLSRLMYALAETTERRNLLWHIIFSDEQRRALSTERFRNEAHGSPYDYHLSVFGSAPAETTVDRMLFTDIMTYLPECLLVKMDVASMANSLEARSPFLDHELVEFCASLPPAWKVHGLTGKYILKQAFKSLLPPAIMKRGKMGFAIPAEKWFRTRWKSYFREVVLSETALRRGYFDRPALERLFGEHVEGKRNHGYRLWALLMLELWHRVYVDREYNF